MFSAYGAGAAPTPFPITNFGQLIDSINHTQDTNAFLQTLIPPTPITPPSPITPPNPIDVSTLLRGNDVSALNNAIARNASDIAQMQALLGQLTVAPLGGVCDLCGQPMPLSSYLAAQGVQLSEVIALLSPQDPCTPVDPCREGHLTDTALQLVFYPGDPCIPVDPCREGHLTDTAL